MVVGLLCVTFVWGVGGTPLPLYFLRVASSVLVACAADVDIT
jgi:hypothetical protein